VRFAKPSNIPRPLEAQAFAVTDSAYGVTGELYRCVECGFLQCSALDNALSFYEDLEDPAYEAGRSQRGLQARKLLDATRGYLPHGRLLDVGAGSGILVEQAMQMGYAAEGIEPSRWLQRRARELQLAVYLGTLPSPEITGPYDVVTLIDVIEHVARPVDLLKQVHEVVRPGGIVAAVTPDVASFAARIARRKWWHFRVAHIGYFDRNNFICSNG
jgi:2-polyprenyl-3-methyl-5-hydroxy-6-metoxy-1,4-benzoquinol methylase